MKKILILFLFLLPVTLFAKPVFQISLSKSSSVGFIKVQDTKSTMGLSSFDLESGVKFLDYFKAFAFGDIEFQSEIMSRNRFSKIGNVPGFSFGLGFGYFKNLFECDLKAGIKAFSEGASSRNYYAMIYLGVVPKTRIISNTVFDVDVSLPVEFSFSSLCKEFCAGLRVSLSYSFGGREQ